ncbi:MAG: sodium-dependent transporter [Gammaproteobacteria bacterium]|nr:sodium-dependent transporter [Gammaproteobacteria bacterium]MBT8106176.1 sodium-dependent transporter [Gammaproteobacteria bacterium]NNF49692.1 sodium-dependent transporter [Woeseiaceae bacterium]NNK26190.1 sodium-dependent transporter [Woeseiaceae bacterium]NNL63440.1 sodium-dependent transporter [Woeseiaceae bacterium]
MATTSAKTWSSGFTFVLAAVGAAVGLGNIWKFPYIVGVSGGGAFVLVYLVSVLFIAIPILIAELWIGRAGGHSPPVAMANVAQAAGRSRAWSLVGYMAMLVGYLIATYYCVIAGWTLAYIVKAGAGFGQAEPEAIAQQFDALQADPVMLVVWHSVFMAITLFIVGRGLRRGIERVVTVLMPALFVMLLIMIAYAAVAGDFGKGVEFLFSTDFSKIDSGTILVAIGQAFFSISVAMGLLMTYGSYVPRQVSLTKSALVIAGADTLVALLAGLMIFPLVFGNDLDPGSGPGLIFQTMPTAFAGMPGGALFGTAFFVLLAFAAVTSLIALIEPIASFAETRWKLRRRDAVLVFGGLAWATGLLTVFSFNIWADVHPLGGFEAFKGFTFFDLIDYFTANLMMPLGGILMALFVGWMVKPSMLSEDLSFGSALLARGWLWMIRIVVPLAILWVLVSSLWPDLPSPLGYLWSLVTVVMGN